MITPSVVVMLIIFLSGTFSLLFFRRNKKLNNEHKKQLLLIHESISRNKFQMANRTTVLGRYDFLKHNLKEALIVQPEINCVL